MAVGHVDQHMLTATMAELRRTLFVRPRSSSGLHGLRSQILWFFRSLMAVELALTRCAISIFFLRTLYTKTFPWLRRIGTYPIISNVRYHCGVLIDMLYSLLLHHIVDCFGSGYHYRNVLTLPAFASQLGAADTIRSLLLRY